MSDTIFRPTGMDIIDCDIIYWYVVPHIECRISTYLPPWSKPHKAIQDDDENGDDLRAKGNKSQSLGEFALGASASDYSVSATGSKTTPHFSSESQFQLHTDYI